MNACSAQITVSNVMRSRIACSAIPTLAMILSKRDVSLALGFVFRALTITLLARLPVIDALLKRNQELSSSWVMHYSMANVRVAAFIAFLVSLSLIKNRNYMRSIVLPAGSMVRSPKISTTLGILMA